MTLVYRMSPPCLGREINGQRTVCLGKGIYDIGRYFVLELAGLSRSKAGAEAESMVFARAKWAARAHILLPCCHLSALFSKQFGFLRSSFLYPTRHCQKTHHGSMMRPRLPDAFSVRAGRVPTHPSRPHLGHEHPHF